MKIDPYKHKERYFRWKENIKQTNQIEGISKANSDLIVRYIFDMEMGINISSVSIKGGRGYPRLNSIRQKIVFFSKKFKEIYGFDLNYDNFNSMLEPIS